MSSFSKGELESSVDVPTFIFAVLKLFGPFGTPFVKIFRDDFQVRWIDFINHASNPVPVILR